MNPFFNITFLKRLLELLQDYLTNPDNTPKGNLYLMAILSLGLDASPNDVAPDELGCAESVNAIHRKAFNFEIGGNLSTYRMYQALISSRFFRRVDMPDYGDVIISPTGFGNKVVPNGHVGIMGKKGIIMSSDSATGLFSENYTLDSWKERYTKLGGYPMYYFRRV